MKQVTIDTVRERIAHLELQAQIGGRLPIRHEFEMACLRQLVASLEAEPVAWMFKERVWVTGLCGYVWREKIEDELPDPECYAVKDIIPLYAAQPALVVPDMIEPTIEAIKRILPTSNPDEYAACIGADMWNACRASMLHGAEPSPVTDNTAQQFEALATGVKQ